MVHANSNEAKVTLQSTPVLGPPAEEKPKEPVALASPKAWCRAGGRPAAKCGAATHDFSLTVIPALFVLLFKSRILGTSLSSGIEGENFGPPV